MFAKRILVPDEGCEHQANIFEAPARIACWSEQEARPDWAISAERETISILLARGDKLIVSVSGIWA